ncbi:MAG TPA: hypothetical protein VK053_05890 [Jiangellaceae bacterium]|nr:hypothetical protein [Jiangellaceae bacterium]
MRVRGPENGIPEASTPSSTTRLLLAAFAGRGYRSGDGGQTWLPVPAEAP